MFQQIRTIFQYEFGRHIRRRGYLFTSFGLPILLAVLMLGYQGITSLTADEAEAEETALFDFEGINIAGYVDLSGLFATVPAELEARLVRYEDVESARTALRRGDVDVYYVIAEDYLETQDVILHLPGFSLSRLNTAPIEQLVYSTFAADANQRVITRLRFDPVFQEFNLERDAGARASDSDADFLIVYVFAIVFITAIYFTNTYLIQSVIEEKETRIIEILVSSTTPYQLLAGKTLAMSALGLLQVVAWGIGLIVLSRLSMSLTAFQQISTLANVVLPVDRFPVMLLYFLGGYLLMAAAYAGVGAVSNSMRDGPQYAALFTLPSILPFYFSTAFIEAPNASLPIGMSLFPLTSPISMIMRLSVTTVPVEQVVISLVLLWASAFGALWVASRLFRMQSLLSGKVPRLREIPALIRG